MMTGLQYNRKTSEKGMCDECVHLLLFFFIETTGECEGGVGNDGKNQ